MLTVCIRIWEDREKHMQRRLGDLTLASPSSLSACSTTHHRPPPPPTTHHFVYPYPHPRPHILDGDPEFLEPSLGGIMGTRHTPKEQNGWGFGRTSPPLQVHRTECRSTWCMKYTHVPTCWCGRAARWCVTGRTGCGWMNGKAAQGKRAQRVK